MGEIQQTRHAEHDDARTARSAEQQQADHHGRVDDHQGGEADELAGDLQQDAGRQGGDRTAGKETPPAELDGRVGGPVR